MAEFEALQAQLQAAEAIDSTAATRGFIPGFIAIPGLEDHDIENGYLRKLRAESD